MLPAGIGCIQTWAELLQQKISREPILKILAAIVL
jgi:hypothetical protein